ncbi:MAG: tRNA pseudouridine(13) synthase TruD [Candidatus Altiarchaeales archaeon WOR_SM1_79]|nr:MAG: tRNA pseudouridine(13) synthase TruD [Candidatus Altiarchaeales archaeon WOR_SM1_79]
MRISGIEEFVGIRCYGSKSKGVGGRIKVLPEDFTVEEITKEGAVPGIGEVIDEAGDDIGGNYTHFTLQKYNWDTMRAVKEISRRLGVSHNRLGFAGTKDKRALTTQKVSGYQIPIENLRSIKIKDLLLYDFEYADEGIDLGDLRGNRFTVTVRDIDLETGILQSRILKIHKELIGGFPNFFGIQRFGDIRPITHLVGKEILRGDFEQAVMIYLAEIFEGESEEALNARKFLGETKNFRDALKVFPKNLGYETAMLNHLVQRGDDYAGALRALPRKLRMMFVHAYQSYIFNLALSEYIKHGFTVERLPLAGYESEVDEISAGILEKEGITRDMFRIPGMRELSSRGNIRDCFIPVKDFEILKIEDDELNEGKKKAVLRFSLPKGCYATVLLREFMKG